MKRIRIAQTLAAIALAAGTAATADAQPRVAASVLAQGAASASNGTFRLNGTVGQAVIGSANARGVQVNKGFWYYSPAPAQTSSVESSGVVRSTGAVAAAVSPNPMSAGGRLRVEVPSHGRVSVRLVDALGRQVAVLLDDVREPGALDIEIDATGLEPGRYLVDVSAGGARSVVPIVVVR